MITNSLQDPRLGRSILGRKRVHIYKVRGVLASESIEAKIISLKRELGKEQVKPTQYQVMFLGEWSNCTLETYLEYKKLGYTNIRVL